MKIPRVDAAPQGVECQRHWVMDDWLGPTEPARGESFLPGQRRGPAATGENKFQSPDQKVFCISTTPSTRGEKRRSP